MTNKLKKELQDTGRVVWFFGRPCAGKSTLAKSVKKELTNRGVKTYFF